MLGDTVRDQEGAEAFDLVERIRRSSIAFHRDDDADGARRTRGHASTGLSDRRDHDRRARLQLFLAPRQHRRGPAPHPPLAGARHRRVRAARGQPAPTRWTAPPTAGIGADDAGRLLRARAGRAGADRASDRGAAQEHARHASWRSPRCSSERDRVRLTPEERAANDEARAPRRADAVADAHAAPTSASR